MRAATIRDGAIVVEEHPDPVPQAGELLVRVKAAGLNGADMMQLAGRYPAPPGAPQDIPGLELAGEVADVGRGVTRFEPGDRVMAVVAGGGQAELAVVHESAASYYVLEDSGGQAAAPALRGLRRRVAHAWHLQAPRLLRLPADGTVRVMLRRDVRERVRALYPAFSQATRVTPLVWRDSLSPTRS